MGLKNLEKDFNKTPDELAKIFVLVSGRLNKMRDYLNFEKSHKNEDIEQSMADNGIVTWSFLEDLALKKSEESPEFQVLIATKGLEEI